MGHNTGVGDGSGHCDVPVQGNGAQIQNGCCAHPHVHCQPHLAPDVAKNPNLKFLNVNRSGKLHFEDELSPSDIGRRVLICNWSSLSIAAIVNKAEVSRHEGVNK